MLLVGCFGDSKMKNNDKINEYNTNDLEQYNDLVFLTISGTKYEILPTGRVLRNGKLLEYKNFQMVTGVNENTNSRLLDCELDEYRSKNHLIQDLDQSARSGEMSDYISQYKKKIEVGDKMLLYGSVDGFRYLVTSDVCGIVEKCY
jgi:hypothetical protein